MSFDRKTFHFNTRKEIEDSLWKTIGPLEDFYKNFQPPTKLIRKWLKDK